jgi:hypothetical protein
MCTSDAATERGDGDAETAQVRIGGHQPRALLPAHLKRNLEMNVRLSRMIAIAAFALPIADAAVAAEGSIRSRDFSVVPMVPMDLGNGTSAPSAAQAKRVVHSRQIIDGTAHGGNGDTVSGVVSQRKPVRRATEFGFGQLGPARAALSSDTQMASRNGDGSTAQRN